MKTIILLHPRECRDCRAIYTVGSTVNVKGGFKVCPKCGGRLKRPKMRR